MNHIQVYKTDVADRVAADAILEVIHRHLPNCNASFDLEDCDNVLRIESFNGEISDSKTRKILQDYGYQIEKLP